ncbi:somatostatin receptor type 5-like [Diaphorina citri]|uniref:Somatostatin receptor type 5-like n=1 Tax=Diaphorina citri TaxID=121845 RepID=A0A3Q0JBF3_DIACI|nr:somatostatin receptor type 5-like [Diaphorina citri]
MGKLLLISFLLLFLLDLVRGTLLYNSNFTDPSLDFLNDTFNGTACPHSTGPTLFFATQTIYLIICITGLLGNTLVIYVVLRFSKMQTVTNMYIVNLAIADECFLIGIPFLMITMSISYWPFGDLMCKIYMTTTSINQFTSSIFLTIMSADRYVAVCHPITAPNLRTPFISKVVSFIAWTASAIFMIPVIMYASIIDSENTKSCNIMWPETENLNGQSAFILYTFILGFAIPLVLIFVFYYLVIRKLRTVGPKNKPKEKKKSHRKVTKLVLTVITVYVLCWLPYWITQIALIFTPPRQCQSSITVIVFLIAGALSYSNSAMNPILYAFLSDNFKKSFLKACTCAAGKDVNATLHLENSVFPRKRNSERYHTRPRGAATSSRPDEECNEIGSRGGQSTTALTSRSNITMSTDSGVAMGTKDQFSNGLGTNTNGNSMIATTV